MVEDKEFIRIALEQARESVRQGGFPAGAVIVKDGVVVAKGVSIGTKIFNPSAHAELTAIREACKVLGTNELDNCVLYGSLEPCLMCFSASNWAGIPRIVYASKRTVEMIDRGYYEGKTDASELNQLNSRKIKIVYASDFEQESRNIVEDWEKGN